MSCTRVPLRFPSDAWMDGDARYRLRRRGRDEWLDDRAGLTDDPAHATDFATATEAALWLLDHVDEPGLWGWEPVPWRAIR
jgi:hypothetical protein